MKKQRKEGTGITKPTNIPQQATIVNVKWQSKSAVNVRMEWTLNGEWVRWREGRREAFDLFCDVIHLRSSTESDELISTLFPLPLQSLSHSSELSLSFSPPLGAMQWSWNRSKLQLNLTGDGELALFHSGTLVPGARESWLGSSVFCLVYKSTWLSRHWQLGF